MFNVIHSYCVGQDMFGHPINLNYKNQGPTYNTLFGGVTSILLKMLILAFTVYKVDILVTNKAPNLAFN